MYSFSRYKEQYRANLKLALPVVLSQVGQILVQFADNAMVGQFGGDDPLPLAAVSFGGAVFFILFVTGMGLTLGLTPLVGERFAQGDKRGAADYLKNAMIFYSVLGFLIAAVQLAVIPLMYRMGQPAEVVDLAIPSIFGSYVLTSFLSDTSQVLNFEFLHPLSDFATICTLCTF